MSSNCSCESQSVMLLACSGASNVGQIANQTALELRAEGYGKMYCIVGIGAHIEPMVQSARDVDRIVAIDGCDVCCARKLLEHLELPIYRNVVVTQLGIEKNDETRWPSECVVRVKEALRGPATLAPVSPSQATTCCK